GDPNTDELQPIIENYQQRRGVGLKLKSTASTSTTASSPPQQQPLVPDPELQDFFTPTQNYLAVVHQREQVLLVQRVAEKRYYDEQMRYTSHALSILVTGFQMPL
ncbi:hypothetical protein TorRG33x02_157200, partial [Trema orientale]